MRSTFLPLAFAALVVAAAPLARAQGLAAYASPSRFELSAKPGQTQRQILDLQHVGNSPGRFRVYTNDWDYRADHAIEFSDELKPDSCRPWVALERRELTVPANGKYRFRFEVAVPADAKPRECRFALMIEGAEPARVTEKGFTFPVTGRLGVIVYLRVGDAQPRLTWGAPRVVSRDGERLPAIEVENKGEAHGRLEGFLNAEDASGRRLEMFPEDLPVLPGRKREIVLRPVVETGKPAPPLRYPLQVKGSLEWGGKREDFEMRFAP